MAKEIDGALGNSFPQIKSQPEPSIVRELGIKDIGELLQRLGALDRGSDMN